MAPDRLPPDLSVCLLNAARSLLMRGSRNVWTNAVSHGVSSASHPHSPYPRVQLLPGRDYTLRHGHPWVFSGAFCALPPDLPPGAIVDVVDSSGAFVARGYLNPANSLAFRMLTQDPDELIDQAFYTRRVERAAALRRLLSPEVTAYRLINAEGDGLPGLIVDHYAGVLVVQFSVAGAERDRDRILATLVEVMHPSGIVARDEIRIRTREGLSVAGASVVYGEVEPLVEIREWAVRYLVDPRTGQKTSFFLDQRDKRRRIGELAHAFPSLLNCFSYTGGFALAGLAGNPALSTVNVDSSGPALELAKRNYTLNGHDPVSHGFEDMDVTRYLQQSIDVGRTFGIVVLDPPAFAKTARDKDRALRAYENLNTLGARVVAPDGLLLSCSCSGAITYDEFEGAVRTGLLRAERQAQIVESFTSSLDHPTLPAFPEDRYLKALLLRLR